MMMFLLEQSPLVTGVERVYPLIDSQIKNCCEYEVVNLMSVT